MEILGIVLILAISHYSLIGISEGEGGRERDEGEIYNSNDLNGSKWAVDLNDNLGCTSTVAMTSTMVLVLTAK